MEPRAIIESLYRNAATFKSLLADLPDDLVLFRYAPDKWNLLEIVCHLGDEEREDFGARLRHILEGRDGPMPSIDPTGWVASRKYGEQDYRERLDAFLGARERSVAWLRGLDNPGWQRTYLHPKFGEWTAGYLLANWLAHDYLHFRQITRNRYEFLRARAGDVGYAGTW